jgi:hypothetical protein
MVAGAIDPAAHITRVGDLEHAAEFLKMVRAKSIDGKAIVYPHRRSTAYLSVPRWTAEDEISYLTAGGNHH